MEEKDKIIKLPEKRIMFRSPQPALKRIEKVVLMDQDELNMLKYLGTTLDPEVKEDDHHMGGTDSMLRKSMSMGNLR